MRQKGENGMVNDLLATVGAGVQRAEELRRLARLMESCATRVEHVLAQCHEIQLLEWKSPAGNAYRDTVRVQAAALRRTADRLGEGSAALQLRSHEPPECSPGAQVFPRWP